ncbi:O-acetyl-ADP-ribose deacetylase (regulator of RNase III) [Natronocella acetinitrilica]|uniref:O-acetyl-ADP-ribose deacetylase (Regulator of RNase III) n=1 Tax=Natronocella acetinitrilica TaxID=414046 RepID=A0AAE3G765_9GAMM|nr:macro domain-containing protein [Natronocella acetinitrilica]MCP1677101.1 O-acetyl-ADP-ribose deacetylase (regulator of RNase III) [Natronocella acetinitrilica]
MGKQSIRGITVEWLTGDIANQPDMDIVVNAANAELGTGGGVAGALHRAAGPGLEEECGELGPIKPGEAVITSAHGLPNRYVVHCLGPVYGRDIPEESLLTSCYRRALQLADDTRLSSIAFPAISSGAFGYPPDDAARVAVQAVLAALPKLKFIRHVRFVLFSDTDLQRYERLLGGKVPAS